MKSPSTIRNEHQAVGYRGRGQHMLIERAEPDHTGRGDVAGPRGVDALQPRFVLPPPDVSAAGDEQPVVVEHRHALKIAGALSPVAVEPVNVDFRSARVEIKLKNLL